MHKSPQRRNTYVENNFMKDPLIGFFFIGKLSENLPNWSQNNILNNFIWSFLADESGNRD